MLKALSKAFPKPSIPSVGALHFFSKGAPRVDNTHTVAKL